MKLHKSILAAAIAALPFAAAVAQVRGLPEQLMSAPAQALTDADKAQIIDKLNNRRNAAGLDNDHGYKVTTQHPGVHGTRITRAAHTWRWFPRRSIQPLGAWIVSRTSMS